MLSKVLIVLLTTYQRSLSLLFGTPCRFYPSCSQYTKEAITLHGAGKGLLLGTQRICRCHPWHEGGYDPVPGSPAQIQLETE